MQQLTEIKTIRFSKEDVAEMEGNEDMVDFYESLEKGEE